MFISDTHTFHPQLVIPEDIDMIIHAGDVANYRDSVRNSHEVLNFIEWYESLNIKHKIWIAGNHDTSVESKLVRPKEICKTSIYLEHESVEIDGIKIFGSPYTPAFGNWAFNVRRDRLHSFWEEIPNDCDILITHGPPKGVLDLVYKEDGFERVGDLALLKAVQKRNISHHVFGHIHNNDDVINNGILQLGNCNTTFINASCVKDGAFSKGIVNQGKTIKYEQ